jgi:hypothetical protein
MYHYPEARRPGDPITAKSPPAVSGHPYCFQVGHCGLDWLTDFDGSFWIVVEWETNNPPSSLNGDDLGSLRLLGPDRAQFIEWTPEGTWGRRGVVRPDYTGVWGTRVTLDRLDGPIVPHVCY